MKLSGRDAARFCAQPDRSKAGLLIYGPDGVEVAARRKSAVKSLLKTDENADLRLTRISGADARRDMVSVADALKSHGFFSGPQVVLVEEATDGLTAGLAPILAAANPDDAFFIATAGQLAAKSKLRKLFESATHLAAAACYGDAPERDEIIAGLKQAGAQPLSAAAMSDLEALARALDRGGFNDLLTRLAIMTLDSPEITPKHVAEAAPGAADAAIDEALNAIAEGRANEIGAVMARLTAQGESPTGLVIAASRRFRQIHSVTTAKDNIDGAIARLRPPVFGPRRDSLRRQCQNWPRQKVEGALRLLLETDQDLRGGSGAAGHALVERAFLKLALSAQRR
jgi:DNA polymerase-3 subunit delta